MTAQIQTEQIVHKGEARIALFFPYEAQLVAQVRLIRWALEPKLQVLASARSPETIFPHRTAPVSFWTKRTSLLYWSLVRMCGSKTVRASHPETTLRYPHVSQRTIQNIRSPWDTLFTEKYDPKREKGGYN